MNIGVIGAGNVGVNLARFWVKNGHRVMLSYSRQESSLREAAASLGKNCSTGSPRDAVAFGQDDLQHRKCTQLRSERTCRRDHDFCRGGNRKTLRGRKGQARFIEPAMMLLVRLAYTQGFGGRIGFRFLRQRGGAAV